jgi:hypothetical protein
MAMKTQSVKSCVMWRFCCMPEYIPRYCNFSLSGDDDVFYLFLQKQKVGAELHIYLEEGTYHKRLFRKLAVNPTPADFPHLNPMPQLCRVRVIKGQSESAREQTQDTCRLKLNYNVHYHYFVTSPTGKLRNSTRGTVMKANTPAPRSP